MKIYSMTATFGKLEHETLTLEPGLNIIHAPNEWGKSTWCTFLVTMLYGLNTSERTKTGSLADKEHYAPWSGSPMSGRIDLCWQGRDITIERRSKGRTPMGEFKAYETESGLPVPELTGADCGQTLLGVERSVFARAGFLRFSDLPVTNDDHLRHRLDALVTTGDDSGQAEALEKKLRDLKNGCRYHKSGQLPAAEGKARALEQKLSELNEWNQAAQRLTQRRGELERETQELEIHRQALRYAEAQADQRQVALAAQSRDQALEKCQKAEAACANLPSQADALSARAELELLRQAVPPVPVGDGPSLVQATQDAAEMNRLVLPKRKPIAPMLALGVAGLVAAAVLAALSAWIPAAMLALAGVVALSVGLLCRRAQKNQAAEIEKKRRVLAARYGSEEPGQWVAQAAAREAARQDYDRRREDYQRCLAHQSGWEQALERWAELDQARQTLAQAERHLTAVQAMARTVEAPAKPDRRTENAAQTEWLLAQTAGELHQIQLKLGRYQGQMEAIGSRDALERELAAVRSRIGELELTYGALERAMKALTDARAELQRRFAPRLTRQAQELFAELTVGRYDRMTLAADLSIQAGAAGEDTLRSPLYRSDGTVDQLYLALRLAVARELTPQAPLVLDDALIRFDDARLAAAMALLRREAENKQIILFTCQGREKGV